MCMQLKSGKMLSTITSATHEKISTQMDKMKQAYERMRAEIVENKNILWNLSLQHKSSQRSKTVGEILQKIRIDRMTTLKNINFVIESIHGIGSHEEAASMTMLMNSPSEFNWR